MDIQTKEIVKEAKKVYIAVLSIKLGESCEVLGRLITDDNEILKQEVFTLEGEAYSNWGSDDTYITNYVCEKMGITII